MIGNLDALVTPQADARVADEGDRTTPPLDGLRFHDQSRWWSSELTRAFASAIRAVSEGAQSEVSEPDELTLGPDVAISDTDIGRGVG